MTFFAHKNIVRECGVVIDIGSGSVGVAIIISNKETGALQAVWSHREYMLIKEYTDSQQLLREISTTLINALLELGGTGMKELSSLDEKHKISRIQVTFSAPWAHTATKTVQYEKNEPFVVQESFINDLVKATKNAETDTENTEKLNELGLQIIGENVVQMTLNEYVVQNPVNKKATTASLSVITSAVQEKILQTVQESCSKIFSGVPIEYFSFINVFYQVLRHLKPATSEVCIVDITNEATEIGIIRDDVLRHITFVSSGLYGLARSIAKKCNIPNEEAYALLKNKKDDALEMYSVKVQEQIAAVFEEYEGQIVKLFSDTGDQLTIPKTIFVHTSLQTEEFFNKRLKSAAKKATGHEHVVNLVTKELFTDIEVEDSALAVSIYYFHNHYLFKKFDISN